MRLLITGASGLLGSNLVLTSLAAGHQVFATSHTRSIQFPDVDWRAADLTRPKGTLSMVADVAPEGIVHCAAATDVDRCEANPAWAFAHNRDMARNVAEAAWVSGASHVHISTDAVFDGSRGPHAETDAAHPINAYGQSKLEGENEVLEANPNAAIVRTNIYGWGPPGRSSLAEWFVDGLRQGKSRPGFTDIRITPMLVNQLSELLLRALGSGLSGTYHIAGGEAITKYDLGIKIAQAFELSNDLIEPTESELAGLQAARPRDLSLKVEKIEKDLGTPMPGLEFGVATFRRLEREGYREKLQDLVTERAVSQVTPSEPDTE